MRRQRLPNWLIGALIVAIIAAGSYLAYTKELPWSDRFQVTATFESAQNLRARAPVRIAGVNVGEVTDVQPISGSEDGAAKVTIELNENGLPLREDAYMKIRPRLFLEGNYFIELQPGSPNAAEVSDGHAFPVNQTAYSVQIDQVLTTLQSDVRANLQTLLDELGNGFVRHGGAEGFRELNRTAGPANRFTAVVNEAFQGTQPGDLSGTISGLERVLGGLSRNEAELRDLVTNFRVFTGSFAAEDEALARAVEQLPDTLAAADPAFANLNASFPPLRAFAVEALPGVRSSPPALRASLPFIRQLRLLMGEPELRGLVSDLRPTVPELAELARANIGFLEQSRSLSSCFNEVVVPFSKDEVDPVDPSGTYTFEPFGKVFEETLYGITGTAAESRSGDANGQHLRVMAGSGANLVKTPDVGGLPSDAFSLTPFPILGSMPRPTDSVKGRFRPGVACETQEPPSLEGGMGAPPPDQQPVPASAQGIGALSGPGASDFQEMADTLSALDSIIAQLGTPDEDAARDRLREAQKGLDAIGLGVDLDDATGAGR